jgi:8-oxo-dGTP pyrophosphatase MutT (NUDIX family)
MTIEEKNKLSTMPFDIIWDELWINSTDNKYYKNEYKFSNQKFDIIKRGFETVDGKIINIEILIALNKFDTQLEWGFPKGRRHKNESDIYCARREFTEETNYNRYEYNQIDNIILSEEFIGSNGIAYKYVYYICRITTGKEAVINPSNSNQISEIGAIDWFYYNDAINIIGKKNLRRIGVLHKLNNFLLNIYKFNSLHFLDN